MESSPKRVKKDFKLRMKKTVKKILNKKTYTFITVSRNSIKSRNMGQYIYRKTYIPILRSAKNISMESEIKRAKSVTYNIK